MVERNIQLLLWVGGLTALTCISAFATGFLFGSLRKIRIEQRIALFFSIGMFNNGIALLIGTILVAESSVVFLPMILYAMFQHLLASLTIMFVGEMAVSD